MKVRYRNPFTKRWTNKDDPAAVIWGVQEGKSFKKVETDQGFDAKIFRNKGKKPEYRYKDSKGRFISKEAAEAIKASEIFKRQENERINEIKKREALIEGDGQTVAFYDIDRTFKSAFIDIFGFNSLVITNKAGFVGRYTNAKEAILAVVFEGRRGAEIAKKANEGKATKGKVKKKKKSKTPAGVFQVSIKMLEDGEYFIHFPY